MQKSFDEKLKRIAENPGCSDFILADAKDGDMGFGVAAPGPAANGADFKSLEDYRQAMRDITAQGMVDIMLMSVSTCEQLGIKERIFAESAVTPAIRANDTTDIWLGLSGGYQDQPSRPFATTTIHQALCGKADPEPGSQTTGADLGLYSITFNNDAELDRASLEAYRNFRLEAERLGFRHFLEVFAPNAPVEPIDDVPRFVNDSIARCLGGVPSASRPQFLKMPYFGPRAMEQLCHYDPTIVVGILGGSAGTTHDAFRMLWEAKKYGARAALFGRKINLSEHQLTFVRTLRAVADGEIGPEEAVRDYHGELSNMGITPHRPLEDDLALTQV